jgi:hypothetical protein
MRGLMNSRLGASLILVTGCSSSLYGWQVRTYSSPPVPSMNRVVLGQEPVAIFDPMAL